MTALSELLRQRLEECSISDPSKETFVTVRLYGKGAVRREVAEGKSPVMRNGYRLVAGDLVYSRIDARNGAFAIVSAELGGGVVSKDFPCFTIRKELVLPSFLIRILGGEWFYGQLRAASFGTTNRQRIGEQALLGYQIPLPPLPEQERIVRILDEADALRRLRAQADARTEAVTAALFQTMFSDAQAAANHWPIRPLGKICSTVSGATPSTENADFWSGTIPWISPKDMKSRELFDATDHVSDSALEASRLRVLPVNAVLIVVRGMILAHTFPVATTRVQATINQDMKALLVHEGILPEYLHWILVSNALQILSLVSTAGHGTKRLEMNALLGLPVAVPPELRQKDFAAHVAEIRELEAVQTASGQCLDDLFYSLRHRAFQGEL